MRSHFAAAIVLALAVASSARAVPDFAEKLQEADRLAWLTDWYSALPIYVLLNDTAAGDDGFLQAREIGQLRLNAGAVVLSACDTSVGPTLRQEGIFNIARAFLHAGARSVITTLWAVSDATSTAVMRRFYENLAAGEDVASARARSKATVLEQFGADARASTAAFQLVGVGEHRVTAVPQKTVSRSFVR